MGYSYNEMSYEQLIQLANEIAQRPLAEFNLQEILDVTAALKLRRQTAQTQIDTVVRASNKAVVVAQSHVTKAEQQLVSITRRLNQVTQARHPVPSKAILPPAARDEMQRDQAAGRYPFPVPYEASIESGKKIKVKSIGTSKSNKIVT